MARRSRAALLLFFFCVPILLARQTEADIINGNMELDYDKFTVTSTDASGNTTRTESRLFSQNYNFNLHLNPFPQIRLDAGGQFSKDLNSSISTGGVDLTSSATTIQSFVDLTLSDPFRIYAADVGYRKTEAKAGGGASNLYNEEYHTHFVWQPLELPPLYVQVSRNNFYDSARAAQDTTVDSLTLSSRYKVKKFDLSYGTTLTDSTDKLNAQVVKSVQQSGRAVYTDSYFNNRVSIIAGYSVLSNRTEIMQQGSGTVSLQLFPFAGLSSLTDTPAVETLGQNPVLIDANTTASSGINIGLAPFLAGDTKLREAGLDFFTSTEVNSIFIWVDQQLPLLIANSFSWDVYTSADNLTWTFLQTVFPATFGPFANRFSINFQNVKSRYIKVVTRGLTPAAPGATNFQNVFITEMQAFLQQPVSGTQTGSRQTLQLYNLDVGTNFLNTKELRYDFHVSLSRSEEPTAWGYNVTNGLTLTHRFSPVFLGTARVSLSDIKELNAVGRITLYNYSATMTATPAAVKTWSSSLMYNGDTTLQTGSSVQHNALSLNGRAELYRGVNVNAVAGVLESSSSTTGKTQGYRVSSGLSLAPRKDWSVAFSFSKDRTVQYAFAAVPGSIQSGELYTVATTYRPSEFMYFTAEVGRQTSTQFAPRTIQNYGANYLPFLAEGNLQISFIFQENSSSATGYLNQGSTIVKTVGPVVTWTINAWASLGLSYLDTTSENDVQKSEVRSLNLTYKMSL